MRLGKGQGWEGIWDGRSLGVDQIGGQEDRDRTGRRQTGKWDGTRTQRFSNIKNFGLCLVTS